MQIIIYVISYDQVRNVFVFGMFVMIYIWFETILLLQRAGILFSYICFFAATSNKYTIHVGTLRNRGLLFNLMLLSLY